MEKYHYTLKVILLGDFGVGKTRLLESFVRFQDLNAGCCCVARSDGGFAEITMCRNKTNILLKLSDTGGQERYRSLTSSYYRGANGCIIMYDVTNEKTFENIRSWFHDLDNYVAKQNTPVILVGANCLSEERAVSYERGQKFAEHMEVPHMEVDSESNLNVMELLEAIVDLVVLQLTKSSDTISPNPIAFRQNTEKKSCCRC